MLARSLDRRLEAGVNPTSSPRIARRARRLTSPRMRKRLANGINGVLFATAHPPHHPSAAIPPARAEVIEATPKLTGLLTLLLSQQPVYAQGMAMLSNLLGDGGGPIFNPAHPGALLERLEQVDDALQGRVWQ